MPQREPKSRRPSPSEPTVQSLSKMEHLPDHVLDWKLEVYVDEKSTIQTRYISDPAKGLWRSRVQETWQRTRRLGRGAFGVVNLEECASGPSQGQLRAVKELHKGTVTPLVYYSRELEAIVKFSHERYQDCFVRSFGWFEDEDSLFITMEYLCLGDLEHYLLQPFPEDQACMIIRQVLQGLVFMHASKYAHRDLKPSNILVSQCGPRWWVKISDFGISKRIEETSLRTIIGSEGYIAPEVRGFFTPDDDDDDDSNDDNETGNGARKSVSLAVDIWAVGAVTFRITTGRVAFQAARDLAKYVSSKRPFPFPIDSTMSSDLTLFLLETMRASPHERPAVQLALAHPWLQTQPPDLPETHFQPNPVTTTSSDGYFARWTTEISSVSSNKTEAEPEISSLTLKDNSETSQINDDSANVGHNQLKLAQTLKGHAHRLKFIAFSQDGKRLISVSADDVILVWDADSQGRLQLAQTLEGGTGEDHIRSVAFSPYGKRLASGSNDRSNTIRVWDFDSHGRLQLTQTLRDPTDGGIIYSLALSPDGKRLVLGTRGSGGATRVWDADSQGLLQLTQTLEGYHHSSTIYSLAFSPDGKRLALGENSRVIRLWDVDSQGRLQLAQTLEGHTTHIYPVAFLPDGKRLISGSEDGGIWLWDTDSQGRLQKAQTLEDHAGYEYSGYSRWVAVSPDGKRLAWASNSRDYKIRLWDSDSQGRPQLAQILEGHTDFVDSVAFSPDGRWLASGASDHTIPLWHAD